MNLGGFEVRATSVAGSGTAYGAAQEARQMDAGQRLTRYALRLTPIYVALTVALWGGLTLLGEYSYVALCHAMAVLSTSGITPIGGFYYAASGFWGELLVFCFFIFAFILLFHIFVGSRVPISPTPWAILVPFVIDVGHMFVRFC